MACQTLARSVLCPKVPSVLLSGRSAKPQVEFTDQSFNFN